MASSARVVVALLFTALTSAVLLDSGEARAAQLTASWVDNSSGTAATRIERRLGTDTTYAALVDVAPGAASYVDPSVSPGTTYCYRAFAWDADGVSTYSDEACATSGYDGYENVTVGKAGGGVGTVVSSPAGINCGTACAATYLAGTLVTLAATPAAGSTFDGWSGACAGTAPCSFAGNTPVSVTASFSAVPVPAPAPVPVSYSLSVAKSGPGTVTSAPAGINCGSDCSEVYAGGTTVTLTAAPNKNGANFTGWNGGGCSGTSLICTVSINATTSVSATFKNGKGR